MASPQEVQGYLAYWFQLGKSVHISNGRIIQRPVPVLEGHQLSRAFQDCWRTIMAVGGRDCYLDGSHETIEQLLSPQWDIIDCARCTIPTAMPAVMPVAQLCPCGDIDHWPNDQLPAPHMPINNNKHLSKLKKRLNQHPLGDHKFERNPDNHNTDNPKVVINDDWIDPDQVSDSQPVS